MYQSFFGGAVDILDYKVKVWRKLPKEQQDQWVEEVLEYYRHTHGFPYRVLSSERIHKDLWRLRRKPARMDGTTVVWDNTANVLCTHYFPHLWGVQFRNKRTALEAFNNDDHLRDAIRLCFKVKPSVSPSSLMDAFALGTNASVGVVSRFKPMAARAIWERYAPDGGTCYDYASGWGGRLMGCISSPKQLTYYGVDPEPRTHECLKTLNAKMQQVYRESNRAHLYKEGSENYCPDDLQGRVDVAFSSPPYFDLEKYSDSDSQSHVKYPDVSLWLDGFLLRTFQNIYRLLKPGGYLALNLVDYNKTQIVAGAQERILACGFEVVETLQVQLAQRRGMGNDTSTAFKNEAVYTYRKPA